MQILLGFRNILMPKTAICDPTRIVTMTCPTTLLAPFHSTGASLGKWRAKFNIDVKGDRQPSKDYIRYIVRQKRADTKKAVKSLLFSGGYSTSRSEDSFSRIEADYADRLNKKSRMKPAHQARRTYHKNMKRKLRRKKLCEDFVEQPESIFEAKFGKQRFTWTFRPWDGGFDWGETTGHYHSRNREQHSNNNLESDDEAAIVGTFPDRRILGLPLEGALKIEDVKAAFRSSALKWHPDKHQGLSQALAEEKFKQCVDAYKSLCHAISTA